VAFSASKVLANTDKAAFAGLQLMMNPPLGGVLIGTQFAPEKV
jgi:hypothetical protein